MHLISISYLRRETIFNIKGNKYRLIVGIDYVHHILVALIEAYESEHYPMPKSSSDQILRHLLEDGNLCQSDLVETLKSNDETVSDIVAGKRALTKEQARALDEKFGFSPGLFSESAT